MRPPDRYPLVLLLAFIAIFAVLAIEPWYRQDWLLENLLVLVAVPTLVLTHRRLRFSNFAYTCLFVFFVLHEIGAHYTYSEVPWREWLAGITGRDVASAGRNHYDRFVHFAYGLLLMPAIRELVAARMSPQGSWRWLVPLFFVMSHSVIYEMIEWTAAVLFGGDLGVAYLGTQGDEWDAQKDMALAAAGAVAGLVLLRIFAPLSQPRHASAGACVESGQGQAVAGRAGGCVPRGSQRSGSESDSV
jgi:putative membrane protein